MNIIQSVILTLLIIERCQRLPPSETPCPMIDSYSISSELFRVDVSVINQQVVVTSRKVCGISSRTYLQSLVLLLSNDCHPNPGPRTPKFPCQICGKTCKWSRTRFSVACNNCELWYHTVCMGMSTQIYDVIAKPDISWYCCTWGLPNFNTSLFEDFGWAYTETTNQSNSNLSTSMASITTNTDIGPPQHTSSPIRKQREGQPLTKKKLRVISVNLQSIRAKKESLYHMLEQTDPDIVVAQETWLRPDIYDREVLPASYKFIARRDRPSDPHGGVAIIARTDIQGTEVQLDSQCEIVAAAFQCKGLRKPLIVGSMYRPPSSDLPYTESLCDTIRSLSSRFNGSVLGLGGEWIYQI